MKNPNLDTIRLNAGKAIVEVLAPTVRRATAFIDPDFVVAVTRRHKPNKRARTVDLVVKIGRPNYRERQFIADCKKSGVAFPLREMQLKFFTDGKIARNRK